MYDNISSLYFKGGDKFTLYHSTCYIIQVARIQMVLIMSSYYIIPAAAWFRAQLHSRYLATTIPFVIVLDYILSYVRHTDEYILSRAC